MSSPTIQNILIKNGMGTKYDRWLKLEQKQVGEPIELSGEQVAFIENSKRPEAAVSAVLTDNGREFCGTETHPYELYLSLNEIEHRRTKMQSPRTNGFVEPFNGTVLDEFFREAFRTTLYETVEALQADMDTWLTYYNTERSHQGYRNMGRRPIETINEYPESVREER